MSPSEMANIICSHEHTEIYYYSGNIFYDTIHELLILICFSHSLDDVML